MAPLKKFTSSHQMLQELLGQMKTKNKLFSLRAFARLIHLSPSHLSQVLAGKKKLSPENAKVIAQKLKLSLNEEKYFLLLVQHDSADSQTRPIIRQKLDATYTKMSSKKLSAEGRLKQVGWPHLLLWIGLEFKKHLDEQAIQAFAEFSGLKKQEIKQILVELSRAGLIEKSDDGYERTHRKFTVESTGDNSHLKSIHLSYLDRLKNLIHTRSSDKRYSVTEFYSISHDKVPLLKQRAEEFLDEVVSYSDDQTAGIVELSLHVNSFTKEEVFGASPKEKDD